MMDLNQDGILEQATLSKLSQATPLLEQWYSSETLKHIYRNDLSTNVNRIFSDTLAQEFYKYCPFPNTTYEQFKNSLLELPELGQAIIGIRFWNLNLDRPFVDVVVSEQLLREDADLEAIKQAVLAPYKMFAPKHLRLFLPSHWQDDIHQWPGAYWEQRYLAARISDMRARPRPAQTSRLQLVKPSDMSFYARYADLYKERVEAQPTLSEYARLETQEDMTSYLEEGTLFEVYINEAWAGLTAVTRHEEQGLRGFVVVEILLSSSVAGQGFGVALQHQLVQQLQANEDDVLFGTIDARNIASIKTAQRSGRQDIGGFLWLPV
ncbi:MAG: hypothetical protein AAF267_10515 [Deinococcota bacterium]